MVQAFIELLSAQLVIMYIHISSQAHGAHAAANGFAHSATATFFPVPSWASHTLEAPSKAGHSAELNKGSPSGRKGPGRAGKGSSIRQGCTSS